MTTPRPAVTRTARSKVPSGSRTVRCQITTTTTGSRLRTAWQRRDGHEDGIDSGTARASMAAAARLSAYSPR